ncbi:MAG: adenosylcobinamide-GDP ribazoletransferase [Candidatus Edwardsbacteria bacterium]
MRQLVLAFQFLTIIPLKVKGDISEKKISQSAAFFPMVGAFQGLLAVLTASLLIKLFPLEITSGLVILILIISNGGFHLDGLADTFDALAVKSSGDKTIDRNKRLSVMKDGATGAIGVISIVMTILLKLLLLNSIFHHCPLSTLYFLLFLMPVFSKWVMIPAMYHGISARQEGLGRIFLNNIRLNLVIFSSLLTIIFCLLIAVIDRLGELILFLILFAMLYIFSFISVKFCTRKFGGLTGDSLGAISEISEILFLMMTSIWLQHFI